MAPGGEVPAPGPRAAERPGAEAEPTVGTGSVVAIGCTVVTLAMILVGVAVLLVVRLL